MKSGTSIMTEKDEKRGNDQNIELKEISLQAVVAEKNKKIEDIIREKKIQKEPDLQKEAHKAVSAFGTGHGIVDATFNGLIGILEATSKVLKSAGSGIPVAGFVFQLLGVIIGAVAAVLDPKASIGVKVAVLTIAAVTIAVMAAGFATAGTAAGLGIGFAALSIGVIASGAGLASSIANYWSLRKERSIAKDFNEVIGLELHKANSNMTPEEISKEISKIDIRISKLQNRIGEEKFLEKLKILKLKREDNFEKADARGDVEGVTPEKKAREEKIDKIIADKINPLEKKSNGDIKRLNQQREVVSDQISKGSSAGVNPNKKTFRN